MNIKNNLNQKLGILIGGFKAKLANLLYRIGIVMS